MDMETPGSNPPGIGLGQSKSPQNPKGSPMVAKMQGQGEWMDTIAVEDSPEPIRAEIPRQVHGQDESTGWKIPKGPLEQGFQNLVGSGSQSPENAVFNSISVHTKCEKSPLAGEKLTPQLLGPGGCMRFPAPQNGQRPLIGASCG